MMFVVTSRPTNYSFADSHMSRSLSIICNQTMAYEMTANYRAIIETDSNEVCVNNFDDFARFPRLSQNGTRCGQHFVPNFRISVKISTPLSSSLICLAIDLLSLEVGNSDSREVWRHVVVNYR